MGTPFTAGSAETGETVASFSQYEQAQKAVSTLISGDVPAKEIAIVGQGLRSIERITGRLGYAAAARSGAVNGLVLGVLFAFVFVIGSPTIAIQAFVGVLLVGIAFGMLLSIVLYSFVRRRRDYASVMQVVADHYEVTVTDSSVGRARQVLGPQSAVAPVVATTTAAPAAQPVATPDARTAEPPKYGERVAPKAESEPVAEASEQPSADATAEEPSTVPGGHSAGPDGADDRDPADAQRADDSERA